MSVPSKAAEEGLGVFFSGSFWSPPTSTTRQLRVTALQLFPTYVVGHEEWQRRTLTLLFWDSLLISSGFFFFPPPCLDPDTEVCLHVLRLLQSVILEPEVLAKSASEMRDTLPFQRIIALTKSRNADLQALAKELLEDLKILEYEA